VSVCVRVDQDTAARRTRRICACPPVVPQLWWSTWSTWSAVSSVFPVEYMTCIQTVLGPEFIVRWSYKDSPYQVYSCSSHKTNIPAPRAKRLSCGFTCFFAGLLRERRAGGAPVSRVCRARQPESQAVRHAVLSRTAAAAHATARAWKRCSVEADRFRQ
jgi:hypothetical protein